MEATGLTTGRGESHTGRVRTRPQALIPDSEHRLGPTDREQAG
jgi:hypothetical protein